MSNSILISLFPVSQTTPNGADAAHGRREATCCAESQQITTVRACPVLRFLFMRFSVEQLFPLRRTDH